VLLNGVACTSSSACIAVGNSAAGKTVAEQWNGTSWQIQPTPNPAGGGFLIGVACTSASSCTATGGSVAGQPLVERWDGASWQIQPTPNLAQGGLLYGVACTSATSCMAVGNSGAGNLAEQWNGASWQLLSAPSPAGAQFAVLGTVACTSASACMAAGAYIDSSGAFRALAERWNGTSWAVQPTPGLAGGVEGQLYGVACTSATGCLAVGFSSPNLSTNQSPATLAERWNGSTWHVQHTPNPPGAAASNLNAASCVSRSACIAVGNTSNRRGTPLTLAQRWNGRTWRIQATPSPANGGNLLGVSCPSRSSCLAVGGHGNPNVESPPGTLAERWNGRTWRIVPTPNPPGGGWFLSAVSCTSPSACTAVGNRTLTRTLAERWTGVRWQVQPTPNPGGGQNIFLASVACPAPTACTAFGLNLTGSGPLTLAERWSGGRWRIQPTPVPLAYDIGFPGVACPTVSACYAVASYTNNGPSLTLVERWNRTGTSTQVAAVRSAGLSTLPSACNRVRMLGSLPLSGRIPAATWSRWRIGGFLGQDGTPSPASRLWCGAG